MKKTKTVRRFRKGSIAGAIVAPLKLMVWVLALLIVEIEKGIGFLIENIKPIIVTILSVMYTLAMLALYYSGNDVALYGICSYWIVLMIVVFGIEK